MFASVPDLHPPRVLGRGDMKPLRSASAIRLLLYRTSSAYNLGVGMEMGQITEVQK
jgi:hypothetical protein